MSRDNRIVELDRIMRELGQTNTLLAQTINTGIQTLLEDQAIELMEYINFQIRDHFPPEDFDTTTPAGAFRDKMLRALTTIEDWDTRQSHEHHGEHQ